MTMFGNADAAFEYFSDSSAITCAAGAAVKGKTFVKLAPGGTDQRPVVVPADAGDRPFGVAAWSVGKDESITVIRRGVISVTAGSALSAGGVAVGANGSAVPAASGTAYGDVLADTASGADAAVALAL